MRAIDDFDGPNSSPYDRHVGLTSQACFSCLALAFPVPVLGLTSGLAILRAIRSMKTKEVPDRESLIVRNGAGREVPYPVHSAEGFGMWPWDDGNELPRVIQVIRVKGSCTFSFLRRFPYRVQRLLWQLLTHPFPSCQYADNLSWVRGLVGDPVHQCIEVPRHVTAVVKVVEYISQRSLIVVF